MEKLRNCGHMACEVALGPLGDTFTTPRYQSVLGEARITVLDFHKRELDAAVAELIYQIDKLSL